MPPRRITDTTGVTWDLWEVDAARANTPVPSAPPPGDVADVRAPDVLGGGWLTARSNGERRRIAPVPTDWMFMTDTQLRKIVEQAREMPVVNERRAPSDVVITPQPPATPRTLVRTFQDAAGVRWDVWEAHAMLRDRREARDRRMVPRNSPDRRMAQAPGYGHGWLVFRCGSIRHRLHAVPHGWHQFSEVDLRVLLVRAARSSRTQSWSD